MARHWVVMQIGADSVLVVKECVTGGEVRKGEGSRNQFSQGTVGDQSVAVTKVGRSARARHGEAMMM